MDSFLIYLIFLVVLPIVSCVLCQYKLTLAWLVSTLGAAVFVTVGLMLDDHTAAITDRDGVFAFSVMAHYLRWTGYYVFFFVMLAIMRHFHDKAEREKAGRSG